AGRVDQDGVVAEPPVAVARPADAAQAFLPEALLQGKAQPRVLQRGGLAGAGRPDDHVPGKPGEGRSAPLAARLLEHGERLGEALAQARDLVLALRRAGG